MHHLRMLTTVTTVTLALTLVEGFFLPEENKPKSGLVRTRPLSDLLQHIVRSRRRADAELEELSSFSECRLDHHERLACGDQEVSEKSCVQRGCCWRETIQPGAPWCFHSARSSHGACAVDDGSRMACGQFGGGGAGLCKKAGCCWRPSLGENVPWCFLPQARSGSLDIRDLFRTG